MTHDYTAAGIREPGDYPRTREALARYDAAPAGERAELARDALLALSEEQRGPAAFLGPLFGGTPHLCEAWIGYVREAVG